jgi:hypothetical protein
MAPNHNYSFALYRPRCLMGWDGSEGKKSTHHAEGLVTLKVHAKKTRN